MIVLNIFNERSDIGGEDVIFQLVGDCEIPGSLDIKSIKVKKYRVKNSLINKIIAFFSGIFSVFSFFKFLAMFRKEKPDLIHVHNIFPFISPSIFLAARLLRIPSVYHVHNFHLTCPVGSHFKDDTTCERCLRKSGLDSFLLDCRGNRFESLAYWVRFFIHRRLNVFGLLPTGLIVVSPFSRRRLLDAGYADNKIHLLPNGVDQQAVVPLAPGPRETKSSILFVGRLTVDKGVWDLIALSKIKVEWDFHLVGTGPLWDHIKFMKLPNVYLHGWKSEAQRSPLYASCDVAVVPSLCFETFGLTAVESMAAGIPTIVANHGGLACFVESSKAVAGYSPGNIVEMESVINEILVSSKQQQAMRDAGLKLVAEYYTRDKFAKNLRKIYETVINKE